MRTWLAWGILPILLLPGAAPAQEAVTVCDTLLAARRIGTMRETAGGTAPESECRRVAHGDIGPVEKRAMIGGAPYECMTIAGTGRCLWVAP